ncbi:hypothetical protein [Candidatus Enterovibrio escicola]|uniref:hypothetical protein n=1 Tax=Candidatus Enterovibrio escicola TaxID=1927127 RepID=UPI001CC2A7E1|nr:hypothetical protein [Candidatus Enterovibrio escacola]
MWCLVKALFIGRYGMIGVMAGRYKKDLLHRGKSYKIKMSIGDTVKNCIGIENWSDIADEKTKFGHYESETVVGIGHNSFLLNMVDKANKLYFIRKMSNKPKICISTCLSSRVILKLSFFC